MIVQFHNKNQFIIFENGDLIFQSYQSKIAKIEKDGTLTLSQYWNFSKTTLTYLYKFLIENQDNLKKEISLYFKNFLNIKKKKEYINNLISKKNIKFENI